MEHDEPQEENGQLVLALEKLRTLERDRANEGALERVLARDDVSTAELLPDGTIRSMNYDGSVTYRPSGWRPRG